MIENAEPRVPRGRALGHDVALSGVPPLAELV
jgi:hypothetical protein